MPCYLNNNIIPGNSVSCVNIPGASWVEDTPEQPSGSIWDDTKNFVTENKVDAALTAGSMLPFAGPVFRGAKYAKPAIKKGVNWLLKSKNVVNKGAKPVQQFAKNGKPLLSGGLKPVFKPGSPVTKTTSSWSPTKIIGVGSGSGLLAKNLMDGSSDSGVDLLTPNAPTSDGPIGPRNKDGVFQPSDKRPKSFWDKLKSKEYWDESLSTTPGDTRLQRLIDELRYASFTDKQKASMVGKTPSDNRRAAMLKQQEIGGKAVAAKLKAANKVGYKWKAKEIRDTGGLFFDAHFGPDWWGGKDKSVEKEKFIRDATDWMEHYRSVINPKTGVLYTLQDIMEQLTKQEEYQY